MPETLLETLRRQIEQDAALKKEREKDSLSSPLAQELKTLESSSGEDESGITFALRSAGRAGLEVANMLSRGREGRDGAVGEEGQDESVKLLGLGKKKATTPGQIFGQEFGERLGRAPFVDLPIAIGTTAITGGLGAPFVAREAFGGGLARSAVALLRGAGEKPATFLAATGLETLGASAGGAAAKTVAPDSTALEVGATVGGGLLGGLAGFKSLAEAGAKRVFRDDVLADPNILKEVDAVKDIFQLSPLEKLETRFLSEQTPLKALEKRMSSKLGIPFKRFDAEKEASLAAAAYEKATLDLDDFAREVVQPVAHIQNGFNRFVKWRRVISRLDDDPVLKKFGGATRADAEQELVKLADELGPEDFRLVDDVASGPLQRFFKKSLQHQLDSGLIDEDTFLVVDGSSDFYAPFKAIKHLHEQLAGGITAGGKLTDQRTMLRAIKGIEDENIKLLDFFQASSQQIYAGRLAAEKNTIVRDIFDKLLDADADEHFIRRVARTSQFKKGDASKGIPDRIQLFDPIPREGHDLVKYVRDGEQIMVEAPTDVANAVNGLGKTQASIVTGALAAFRRPLALGAINLNLGFQMVNFAFSDLPRLALTSEARVALKLNPVKSAKVLGELGHDLMVGTAAAFKNNFPSFRGAGGEVPQLAREAIEAGAMGGTKSKTFIPEIFRSDIGLDAKKLGSAINPTRPVLDGGAKFSNFIEEATKLTGFRRLKRMKNIDNLSPDDAAQELKEMAVEVRRFVGSPDFARLGSVTKARALNLLFPFMNARLQGSSADLSRLLKPGTPEGKAAHKNLALMAGAVAMNWANNHSEEHREGFDTLSEFDKDSGFMIPWNLREAVTGVAPKSFKNFVNQNVSEYIKIPKRDILGLYGTMVERALDFFAERDPEAAKKFIETAVEEISPINIRAGKDTPTLSIQGLEERAQSAISSLNPLVKAPAEFATGRDTFRQRDTVPSHLQDADPEFQRSGNESGLGLFIANQLNNASDLIKEAGVDIGGFSPAKVDQLLASLTGGFNQQLSPRKSSKGRGLEDLRKFPILGAVVNRFTRSETGPESEQTKRNLEVADKDRADSLAQGVLAREKADELLEMSFAKRVETFKQLQKDDEDFSDKVARQVQLGELSPEERSLLRIRSTDKRDPQIVEFLLGLPPDEQVAQNERLVKADIAPDPRNPRMRRRYARMIALMMKAIEDKKKEK